MIALFAAPPALLAQDAAALLQELQKTIGKEIPRNVRLSVAGSGYKAGDDDTRVHYRIEPHTVPVDPAAPNAIWTTPLGFLTAAAAAAQPTVTSETLFGTKYQVIAVTGPNKEVVRGYVTEKNVLERIRTNRQEAVFLDWREFDGMRFPSLIIEKENDQVSRILVVTDLDHEGTKDAKDTKS